MNKIGHIMTSNTYNGYTNYATWNFILWASNDEGSYKAVARAGRALKRAGLGWDAIEAEKAMRDVVGDETPDGARAAEVNWDELAEALEDWE